MEKCNQSEKAVEYIANQIEKLEKNVNEYQFNRIRIKCFM